MKKYSRINKKNRLIAVIAGFVLIFSGAAFAGNSGAGEMILVLKGLDPRSEDIPFFTLMRNTNNNLVDLGDISRKINASVSSVNRREENQVSKGGSGYKTSAGPFVVTLPPGDYYLINDYHSYESSGRHFRIEAGRETRLELAYSHADIQVAPCGFEETDSVTFQIFVPHGPPVYRAEIPCGTRSMVTLEPGGYNGIVIRSNGKKQEIPFVITEGDITPVVVKLKK